MVSNTVAANSIVKSQEQTNKSPFYYLRLHSKGSAAPTRARSAMRAFLSMVYKTDLSAYGNKTKEDAEKGLILLDQIATRYLKEGRTTKDFEADCENFLELVQGRPPKTAISMLSDVRIFLRQNEVAMNENFWKNLNKKIKGRKAWTKDRAPKIQELCSILSLLDVRARAFCAIMKDSGVRPKELTLLKRQDIHFDEIPARIELHGNITKNGDPRETYITIEAIRACQDWDKIRDPTSSTYFPVTVQDIEYAFNEAAKKLGLDDKDSSTGRLKLHLYSLRKFFNTRLKEAGMPESIVHQLMGHEGYMSASYDRSGEEAVKTAYLKYQKALFANETTELATTNQNRVEGLEHELTEMKSQMTFMENQFEAMMDFMRQKGLKFDEE